MGQAGDTAQAIAGSHSLFHSQTVSKMQISILKKKKCCRERRPHFPHFLPGEMSRGQQMLPEQEGETSAHSPALQSQGPTLACPFPTPLRADGEKVCSPFPASRKEPGYLCRSLKVFCSRKILKLCNKQFYFRQNFCSLGWP